MRRHLLGIIGIALLAGGLIWYSSDPTGGLWQSACLRVGAILCALWLALPQLQSMSLWLYATVVGSVVLIAKWPKLAWVILPAAIVMWILKPRTGTSAKRSASTSRGD